MLIQNRFNPEQHKIQAVYSVFIQIIITSLLFFFSLNVNAQPATFSLPASNKVDCGWTGTSRSVTIPVLGITSPLSPCLVLREVRVRLGRPSIDSPSCLRSLNTYRMELIAPDGVTKLNLAGSAVAGSNPPTSILTTSGLVWINVKFRDHPVLKRLRDYPTSVQSPYFPFSIGYYRSQDPFSAFNGVNPNGNWTFTLLKGTTTNGISIENVELIFGPPVTATDLTGNKDNDFCSGAACISNGVHIGTNVGYSSGDPLYPGNMVNGCDWNGANSNSAWFKFVPRTTNVKITLSGLLSNCIRTADVQAIVLKSNGCGVPPNKVSNGGCLDDISINNREYLQSLGGGTMSSPYTAGITANAEFRLSNLTVGDEYFLYIDGNSYTLGTPCLAGSTFYIEVENGVEFPCPPPPSTCTITGPGSICSGAASVQYTINGVSPCERLWALSNSNAGSIDQTGIFIPVNNLTTAQTTNIIYSGTGCNTTYPILVIPKPAVILPGNSSVSAEEIYPGYIFNALPSGTVVNWFNSNPSIGLAASGTGDIPSFKAINTGTSPLVATINVNTQNGGCNGERDSFRITVLPRVITALGNERIKQTYLSVYPNPARNLLQVKYSAATASKGEIILLDMQGRRVYSRAVGIAAGENRYDLNLSTSGISTGNYVLKLQSGNTEKQIKLVVIK